MKKTILIKMKLLTNIFLKMKLKILIQEDLPFIKAESIKDQASN